MSATEKLVTLTDEAYRNPQSVTVRLYVESMGTVACRRINMSPEAMDLGMDVIGSVWTDTGSPLGVGWSCGLDEFRHEASFKIAVNLIGEARLMLLNARKG